MASAFSTLIPWPSACAGTGRGAVIVQYTAATAIIVCAPVVIIKTERGNILAKLSRTELVFSTRGLIRAQTEV